MTGRVVGIVVIAVVCLAAGCGGSPTPTADLVATEVAVQKAAAATVTSEAPSRTPLPSATPEPTATCTPLPCDLSAFAPTQGDLPAGFVDIASLLDRASSAEGDDSDDHTVESSFSFVDEERGHFVWGWMRLVSTSDDQQAFDRAIRQPEYPVVALVESFPITALSALESPPGLGDSSRAVSAQFRREEGAPGTLEWIYFRRGVVKALVMVACPPQDTPRIHASEVARLVDDRIVESLRLVPGAVATELPQGLATAVGTVTPAGYCWYENAKLGFSASRPEGWDVQVEDVVAPVGGKIMGEEVCFSLPGSLQSGCGRVPRLCVTVIFSVGQTELPSEEYYLNFAVDNLRDHEVAPELVGISLVEVGGYRAVEVVTREHGSLNYLTYLETEDRFLYVEGVGYPECCHSIGPIYRHFVASFKISALSGR